MPLPQLLLHPSHTSGPAKGPRLVLYDPLRTPFHLFGSPAFPVIPAPSDPCTAPASAVMRVAKFGSPWDHKARHRAVLQACRGQHRAHNAGLNMGSGAAVSHVGKRATEVKPYRGRAHTDQHTPPRSSGALRFLMVMLVLPRPVWHPVAPGWHWGRGRRQGGWGSGAGKGGAEGMGVDQHTRKAGQTHKKGGSVGGMETPTERRMKRGCSSAEWEKIHTRCTLAPSGGWRQNTKRKQFNGHIILYVHWGSWIYMQKWRKVLTSRYSSWQPHTPIPPPTVLWTNWKWGGCNVTLCDDQSHRSFVSISHPIQWQNTDVR